MASTAGLDALLLSLRTTALTMVIIILRGTPATLVLPRTEFPGKRLVNTLVDILAVLPLSAAGIALLFAFGRAGLLGEHLQAFGLQLSFTTAAVVLAELFVVTHFYVRLAAVSFAQIDRDVEAVAMVDGASRTRVLTKITVPLALPEICSRGGYRLGACPGRVWGHYSLRRQLPGGYADHAAGHLQHSREPST
jgi:molybdate transport system permease protein